MRHRGYLGQRTKLIIRNMAYKYVEKIRVIAENHPVPDEYHAVTSKLSAKKRRKVVTVAESAAIGDVSNAGLAVA